MQCFRDLEIHPQSPADVAALARAESHAKECERCATRLGELREVDALMAAGLLEMVHASPCPEPVALAAWIDAGRPADVSLEEHLSGCEPCRADLLDAVEPLEEIPTVRRAPSSARRKAIRPRHTVGFLAPAAAAAAVLVTAGLVWTITSSKTTPPSDEVIATAPAPRLTKSSQPRIRRGPVKPLPPVAPAPRKQTNEPALPTRPVAKPTPEVTPRPQPAKPIVAPAPVAKKPAPVVTPEQPKQTPAVPKPTPPAPPKGAAALALRVESAGGLLAQAPGKTTWTKLQGGEIPAGTLLKASSRGARFQAGGGLVLLAPRARMEWKQALTLSSGQAILEGPKVRVETAGGVVEVTGRSLLEVRRKKLGVQVLFGRAVVERDGQRVELAHGAVMTATRGKPARVRPGNRKKFAGMPPWAKRIHPKPRRGVRPPRPAGPRGRRGPRKPGTPPGRGGKTGKTPPPSPRGGARSPRSRPPTRGR